MSWKPEYLVSGKWCDNALRFPTKEEAEDNAANLIMRWTVPSDWRVAESADPANYRIISGNMVPIPHRKESSDGPDQTAAVATDGVPEPMR